MSIVDIFGLSEDQQLELATAVSATTDTEITYLLNALDPNALIAGNITNIFYEVNQAELSNITMIYGNVDLSSCVAGTIAGVDYEALNGTISLAFKQFINQVATITNSADASVLDALNVNYLGNYDTRGNDYTFFYRGCITGNYKTIANFSNNAWLADRVQVTLINLFLNINKLIYTNAGYTTLVASLQGVIQAAINNGTIAVGTVLDANQRLELKTLTGVDIANVITTTGYYIQVVPATPDQRIEQIPPIVNFFYANGGEIIKVQFNNTLVE